MLKTAALSIFALGSFAVAACAAEKEYVAVAASMAPTMEKIAAEFQKEYGVSFDIASGASGKLAAQIRAGAPFGLFLAADDKWTVVMKDEGFAEDVHRIAAMPIGLWSPTADAPSLDVLKDPKVTVAIADPNTAPFGALAKKWLTEEGLWDGMMECKQLIVAGSINQAGLAAKNKGADYALIARSTALGLGEGSWTPVPVAPMANSGAIITANATENVRKLWEYLRSEKMWHYWDEVGFVPVEE